MSLEWMDNFSVYGVGAGPSAAVGRMLDGPYAEVGTRGASSTALVEDPDPLVTTTVVYLGVDNGFQGLRRVLSSTQTTVGIAQRFWLTRIPTSTFVRPIVYQSRDVNNVPLTTVQVTPTGALEVRRGDHTGTVIGTTTGPVLVTNAWQHIECKILHSATAGTVEVRVEGVTVLNLTGQNTSSGGLGCAQVAVHVVGGGGGDQCYVKDFVVWNGGGSSNNNFLGAVIVVGLLPASDEALNWTPVGAANGWSILDNAPPVDTDYIEAGTGPIPAAYAATLTDLPPNVTSVRGVMTLVRARKTDGGDGNIQVSALSGASAATGANRPITSAFTYWSDIFEQDPATAAAWTPSGVNGMRMRINRTV